MKKPKPRVSLQQRNGMCKLPRLCGMVSSRQGRPWRPISKRRYKAIQTIWTPSKALPPSLRLTCGLLCHRRALSQQTPSMPSSRWQRGGVPESRFGFARRPSGLCLGGVSPEPAPAPPMKFLVGPEPALVVESVAVLRACLSTPAGSAGTDRRGITGGAARPGGASLGPARDRQARKQPVEARARSAGARPRSGTGAPAVPLRVYLQLHGPGGAAHDPGQ